MYINDDEDEYTTLRYYNNSGQERPMPQMLMIIDLDGQPRYMCSNCSVKYKDASRLQHHLRECGLGAQCPICGFVCKQRRNLPDHMMTHDKQSPAYRRQRMMRAKRRELRQQQQRMMAASVAANQKRRRDRALLCKE